jgi:hypothetical protein
MTANTTGKLDMKTTEFKQALRNGAYAWPGGYPMAFLMADGESLSFRAARENAKLILATIRRRTSRDWLPVCAFINWEDTELFCAHSGERIESAYGDI